MVEGLPASVQRERGEGGESAGHYAAFWLPGGVGQGSANRMLGRESRVSVVVRPLVVVTCAQCREEVLEADLIGDEEECLRRDHLLVVHPQTVQPETLTMLLSHFVVIEEPPPAA